MSGVVEKDALRNFVLVVVMALGAAFVPAAHGQSAAGAATPSAGAGTSAAAAKPAAGAATQSAGATADVNVELHYPVTFNSHALTAQMLPTPKLIRFMNPPPTRVSPAKLSIR